MLISDDQLPELSPKKSPPGDLIFRSYSMSFWVIPEAKAPACYDQKSNQ